MIADAAPPTLRRRRHGRELEVAILDAGWTELVSVGYANLTMESVARRAETSEPVLYRRWPNKDELVLAVLTHHRAENALDLPDTGTLRGDLLATLTRMGESGAGFIAVAAATALGGLAARTGLSAEQIRDRIFGEERMQRMMLLYERAHERGEIDLAAIDPVVLALPFDLVRHDLLMNPAPVSAARITSIVDGVFLPLVRR